MNVSSPYLRFFFLALVTALSGAMMPGPMLAAVISQTALQGWRACAGILLGHAILELGILGLMAFGFQRALARRGTRAAIGLIGGAALLWMGADMLRCAGGISLELAVQEAKYISLPMLVLLGAMVSIANPYFTGWWATIGAGQVAQLAPRTFREYTAFYIGHEGGDIVWYGFIAAAVITGRNWLSDEIYRMMIYFFGVVLLALGLLFLVISVRLLRYFQLSKVLEEL
ncbi:LysE family transporter [Candidatus Sumerlaeota bacterium]|nr:LysE family transporter [Candidatus Sumerlaeota bacterium]